MDLKQVGIYTSNWVDSAKVKHYWRALVNAALVLSVPQAMQLANSRRKRCLGRPRRGLEDHIRQDLKEIDVDGRSWVDSAQGRECGEPF